MDLKDHLRLYNKIKNSTIGLIGVGYIGGKVFQFLQSLSEEFNIKLYVFDRSNLESVSKYKFDYFINCTGNTGDFRNNIFQTAESNITLTSYLLQNLKIKESYVCLSSTRIYGFSSDNNVIFDETMSSNQDHLKLDFLYDGAKKYMESLLMNLGEQSEFRLIVVRLSNIFGAYKIEDLNKSTFLKILLEYKRNNKSIKIQQNRQSAKDYLFIEDAVKGILLALFGSTQNEIYNIASGSSISAERWINYLGLDAIYDQDISPIYSNISINKAKEHLGFEPSYQLDNLSIEQIIKG